jgi:SAM-dependent methyltransferase
MTSLDDNGSGRTTARTDQGDDRDERSRAWHQVWDRRDPAKLEYDGYEDSVVNESELERLRHAQASFISRTLELQPDDHLLDLGCGTGALTSLLATRVGLVTAIDYSRDAVASARRRMSEFGDAVEVIHADVASFDLRVGGATKAVAVGSMHYLDSYNVVHRILTTLSRRGVTTLVVDLPDASCASLVVRDYDQRRWSHLAVDVGQMQADFHGSVVHRGMFPWYTNDALRFSILIPPEVSAPQ